MDGGREKVTWKPKDDVSHQFTASSKQKNDAVDDNARKTKGKSGDTVAKKKSIRVPYAFEFRSR
jgi:plastocyanin